MVVVGGGLGDDWEKDRREESEELQGRGGDVMRGERQVTR